MKSFPIFFASLLLLASCGHDKPQSQTVHSVMTIQPQGTSTQSQRNFSGTVKEQTEINLGFRTPGQIESVLIREGQYIHKGQLLAVLDSKDYKLGVAAALSQYKQMKDEVARMRKLYEGRSLSGNDYEKATSGLEQLGIQLQTNRNKLSYCRLYADQDGYVQSVNFHKGEFVNAGTPVFTILDTKRMEVEVSVPEDVYLNRGNIRNVYCVSAGKRYPLSLKTILPKTDGNQLYDLRFNLSSKLTAGLSVNVVMDFADNASNGNLTLPPHAVFEDQGNSYVWLVSKDGKVSKREVTVDGTDDNGDLIISNGLNGNETIVKAGVRALRDNEKVKVIAQPSKTNVGELL